MDIQTIKKEYHLVRVVDDEGKVHMYKRFGYFPAPADVHIADYMWCVDEEMGKLCDLAPFDVTHGSGAEMQLPGGLKTGPKKVGTRAPEKAK